MGRRREADSFKSLRGSQIRSAERLELGADRDGREKLIT